MGDFHNDDNEVGGGRGSRGRYNGDNRERGRGGGFRNRERNSSDGNDERSNGRFSGERGRGSGGRGDNRGRYDRRGTDDERRNGQWEHAQGGDQDRDTGRKDGYKRQFDREEGGDGSREGRSDDRGRHFDDHHDSDDRGWGKNDDTNKGDAVEEEKKPVTYIPTDRTEEDLFSESGIRKGVNFADFDNIKVQVSGENTPQPINSFDAAQLRELILSNLKKCNYDMPTPIQKYALPVIMAGRDLMATAQTGSGKTAAYLVPIVQSLLSDSEKTTSSGSCVSPRAIILSPTRELAIQIEENARRITSQSSLRIVLLYGGVQPRHQSTRLSHGCDIVIATVGRLKDFVNRGFIKFDAIQFVVLDEADRMLDLGFSAQIQEIMKHETMTSQDSRQTLMFSATFSSEIQKLAGEYLRRDYVFVAVGIVGGASKDVEQNFIEVEQREKKSKLLDLLANQDTVDGTLMFVEKKRSVDYYASCLCEKGYKTTSIHGDRLQAQREEALGHFKSKRMHILVATSVAARGLDIIGVKHVINFDMPKEIDEYVHRIGRTGRLGNKGKATSFYESKNDRSLANNLVQILQQADQQVPDFIKNDATSAGDYVSGEYGGVDYRNEAGAADGADDWND